MYINASWFSFSWYFYSRRCRSKNYYDVFVLNLERISQLYAFMALHQRWNRFTENTAQKMKLSIKDFFCKWYQNWRKLQIWSHLLKKFLMKNFIFCAVKVICPRVRETNILTLIFSSLKRKRSKSLQWQIKK